MFMFINVCKDICRKRISNAICDFCKESSHVLIVKRLSHCQSAKAALSSSSRIHPKSTLVTIIWHRARSSHTVHHPVSKLKQSHQFMPWTSSWAVLVAWIRSAILTWPYPLLSTCHTPPNPPLPSEVCRLFSYCWCVVFRVVVILGKRSVLQQSRSSELRQNGHKVPC